MYLMCVTLKSYDFYNNILIYNIALTKLKYYFYKKMPINLKKLTAKRKYFYNYNEKNQKIFKIKPKSKNKFYIFNYSEYKSGGYKEETFFPKTMCYESFEKKFIFLVFKALIDFYDS